MLVASAVGSNPTSLILNPCDVSRLRLAFFFLAEVS